eukprot:712770-Amphidinium_carterae.2
MELLSSCSGKHPQGPRRASRFCLSGLHWLLNEVLEENTAVPWFLWCSREQADMIVSVAAMWHCLSSAGLVLFRRNSAGRCFVEIDRACAKVA